MISKPTMRLGAGPAAVACCVVPDLDHFRGSFGGKDVIPLYRDTDGTPNCAPSTIGAISEAFDPSDSEMAALNVEVLYAYAYGILAGGDYTTRFAEALETPGPRMPLTSDPALFGKVATLGEELLWLHTFGDRCSAGRPTRIPLLDGLAMAQPVRKLPQRANEIRYDPSSQVLQIGNGLVEGVRQDVWEFEVSGMHVVRKWLSYRMARPAGRAASSTSPLDAIRPSEWLEEWTKELLELVTVLTMTLDLVPRGVALLDEVLASPLIASDELPPVPAELRQPPAVPPPTPDSVAATA
jgi:hypothetical protein